MRRKLPNDMFSSAVRCDSTLCWNSDLRGYLHRQRVIYAPAKSHCRKKLGKRNATCVEVKRFWNSFCNHIFDFPTFPLLGLYPCPTKASTNRGIEGNLLEPYQGGNWAAFPFSSTQYVKRARFHIQQIKLPARFVHQKIAKISYTADTFVLQ